MPPQEMRLPIMDEELNEDEFEGLVSSSVGTASPRRSAPKQSWLNSSTVAKRKKFFVILAVVLMVIAMVGLRNSDGNAVDGVIKDPKTSIPKVNVDDVDNDDDDGTTDAKEDKDNLKTDNDDDDDDDDKADFQNEKKEEPAQNEKESSDNNADDKENETDKNDSTEPETKESEKEEPKEETPKEEEPKEEESPKEEETPKEEEPKEEPSKSETTTTTFEYPYPKEKFTTDQLPWTKPMTDEEKEALVDKYGKWHFWDGTPEIRPKEDFLAKYPNRDCPFDDFPETAWQADAVYVNHMLDSASELVARAKEAIYTEYGYGPRDELEHDQLVERMEMFKLTMLDLDDATAKPDAEMMSKGGWATRKSLHGLSLRLLHSMMTSDTFTIVLGGHSAAAGHGNHFLQSYMMQMYKVLRPIFDRVGVELIVRNLAQGGMGTIHKTMGSLDMYGENIDVLIWDSSMTEKEAYAISLFYRQQLMSGKHIPVLISGPGGPFDILRDMYLHADADVMGYGSGMHGMPLTTGLDQVETLPFAARHLKCDDGVKELCADKGNPQKYNAVCWIERDDVTPSKAQRSAPGGQVGWHPGFRQHQLTGRTLAMIILTGMSDAIDKWSETTIFEGHPLRDDMWHITEYYDNIREKALAMDASVGGCDKNNDLYPKRVCNSPMRGRSEHTPRANPDETSFISIMKAPPGGIPVQLKREVEYEGPDVPNPALYPPEGSIDVPPIILNRRRNLKNESVSAIQVSDVQHGRRLGEITPGKGFTLDAPVGYCDGTAHGICGREKGSDCLLSGHHDARGGILADSYSGWFVVNIPVLKNGLIILNVQDWLGAESNTATTGWSEPNNGEYDRRLKYTPPAFPDDFLFEYAINGEIKSLTYEGYGKIRTVVQRVNEFVTLLDDADMKETENVEVAWRVRNGGRNKVFSYTHLYWS